MGKADVLGRVGLMLGLAALSAGALSVPAMADGVAAGGTHQCRSQNGSTHTCVVTARFGDCISAESGLQVRDCCPSSRGGGTSTGFVMNYCVHEHR
jgi:hypothetical protein